MSIITYIRGNYPMKTRLLVRSSMFEAGWKRMSERPKDGVEAVLGQEWIDRRYGVTDQFLTALGSYSAESDEWIISKNFTDAIERIPANKVHWYNPVHRADDVDVLNLHAANIFRGMAIRVASGG